MTQDKRVFHTLDALRGVAALVVISGHLSDDRLKGVLANGYLAVDLFFVLSGFVLAHAYEHRLKSGLGFASFMTLRWVRLFPLFALGLVAGAALEIAKSSGLDWVKFGMAFIASAFFLPVPMGFTPDAIDPFPFNSPSWSLFCEMAVNMLFALVAARLDRRLLLILIGGGAVALIASGAYYHSLNIGFAYGNFLGGLCRVGYSFFAGVGVYRLYLAGWAPKIHVSARMAILILLLIFLIPIRPHLAFDLPAALLLFPLLVLAAAREEPAASILPVYKMLGTASYAIYMIQAPLINWLNWLSPRLFDRPFVAFGYAGSVVVVVVILGAALILDQVYDAPVRRWLGRWLAPART